MSTTAHNNSHKKFKKNLLHTCIAMHLVSGVAYANEKSATEEEMMEVIQVKSQFKRNLETALFDKRFSAVVSDGISADDIGSLPALDMGEALQAVPGIQLNREGERRESSVNLRGLPSGFVLTTANGQSIANPTRSTAAFGAPNPFGAYDPAVFNGINVVKSQTAEMQEGGIAGSIDQKLYKALSRPKNSLMIQLGARNEKLADSIDGEFVISASKHLIDDELAVTATAAYSQQTFRRDTIKINRYDALNSTQFAAQTGTQTFDEWKDSNNLPANAVVKMPGELRQGSEINEGSRLSFSGGIEYKPTENLKLGANVIFTERDMGDNRYEQIELRTRYNEVSITPLTAPQDTGKVDGSGNPVYSVPDIGFENVRYAYDNRGFAIYEQSQAILLDAEWTTDNWKFDSLVSISKSENEWDEILISPRFDKSDTGTGVTGRLYTGEGEIGDFVANVDNFEQALNLDELTWVPRTNVTSSGIIPTTTGRYLLMTGTWENIQRDSNAFEFNAERGFSEGIFSSVKFGYRFSTQEQDSKRLRNSGVGIDPTGILTNSVRQAPNYVSEGAFFGGEAPGFASYENDGWYSFDFQKVNQGLVGTIDVTKVGNEPSTGESPVVVPTTGYIARGGQQGAGLVYDTKLDTSAAYAMANFDFDAGSFPIKGNMGLRYVSSDLEAGAPFFEFGVSDINNPERRAVKHDYDYVLPSLNTSISLTDDNDLIARFAYNQSIVRPNLRAVTPASSLSLSETKVTVSLPSAQIDPFKADSFDFSIEWYNREGSAITLALFKKDIENYFQKQSVCDNQVLEEAGYDIGTVSLVNDQCVTDGNDGYSDPDLITAGDDVAITQIRNIENTVSVSGLELSIQQNLDFLPYPWNGLGGVFNYSKTSQDKANTVQIPGISDETYNVIGYYEQDNYGLRFSYNFRTEYELESVGTFNGVGNKNVKAAGRLDMSAYYKATEDLTLSFKAYNLTNTLYEEYEDVEWQPRATHYDGQTFGLYAKYKFY
ncbi:TonB-dependent receptor [Catenovulum maritimum]|uniref:Sulfurtransferase n=1 Tax=Catenovulum maritimum TaxID=1513271 RepID=A0A0J8GUW4_9ALTE|nr:TonB-dependent receptor [Catenovulum maritimum]KMT64483.1 sulfurtransferase [Catenovulum maritimum]